MNSVNLTTVTLLVKYELKLGGAPLTVLVRLTMVGDGGLVSFMSCKNLAVTRKVPLTLISKSLHHNVDEDFSITSDGLVDRTGSVPFNNISSPIDG